MTEEKTSFDLIVDVEREDEIILKRCRSKAKEPIVIWQGTVGRTPEISIAFGNIHINKKFVTPEGKNKIGNNAWLYLWPTGQTSMPGEKEENVTDIYVGIGDEFFAGEKKFKVFDLYEGYVTVDTRVRPYICLEEIKQHKENEEK